MEKPLPPVRNEAILKKLLSVDGKTFPLTENDHFL